MLPELSSVVSAEMFWEADGSMGGMANHDQQSPLGAPAGPQRNFAQCKEPPAREESMGSRAFASLLDPVPPSMDHQAQSQREGWRQMETNAVRVGTAPPNPGCAGCRAVVWPCLTPVQQSHIPKSKREQLRGGTQGSSSPRDAPSGA